MSTTIYVPRVFGGTLLIAMGVYAPPRVLSVIFAEPLEHINATFAEPLEHINATFSEGAMTTPYTTIDTSATVKDQSGSLISTLSVYTLSVSYQDGTTATPTVNNAGSGVYTATYATKGPGVLYELWSFTDSGGSIAQDQVERVIAY